MSKGKRTETWLEKGGIGPLPHYREVRRTVAIPSGLEYTLVIGAFVLLGFYPGLLWWVIGAVLIGIVTKAIREA